jgi:site-specific recombinase XerD
LSAFAVSRGESIGNWAASPEDRGVVNLTQEFAMGSDAISPLRQRMIEDMSARQLQPPTQKGHIRACMRFAAFFKRSPETATAEDIRRFQLHLAESDVSICHRNRTMTGLRFLFRVTLRRLDLAEEIYHIKEPQKIPLVMSPDETRRLLAVARTLKVRVLLALGYGCGLRASEVVRLRVGDIDSAQGIIRVVQSKGRKDRNVMLSPEVLALLRQWWKTRPRWYDIGVPPEERWLFPGIRRGRPMTTRQLNRLFHQTADAAGIRKPVTLHSLRHSFATHLLERGTDIRVIQALLGHSKLEATARYTQVATGMISAVESPFDLLAEPGKRVKRKGRRKPAA